MYYVQGCMWNGCRFARSFGMCVAALVVRDFHTSMDLLMDLDLKIPVLVDRH